ncbi:MAG: hypothetical protein AAFP70_01140 [Calditrichota bacterium]
MGYYIRTRFAFIACLLILLSCTEQAPRSPFQSLEWSPNSVVCYIDNQQYKLERVGNVETAALLKSCKRQFGQSWIEVFESDFDAVLKLLNIEGNAVTLGLLSLADSTSSVQTIPLLEENIQLINRYRRRHVEKIDRPLPDSLSAHFSPAASTFGKSSNRSGEDFLPADLLFKDLAHIEWLLENHSIYLHDSLRIYREAIDALRLVGKNGMSADDFYTEALLFFASCRKDQPALRFETATISSRVQQLLPIHIHEIGNRLAAFSTRDNSLINPDHPYLVQINGVAVEQWLNAAVDIYGSPFMDETRDVEIARVNLVSRRFGVEPGSGVMLGLESADGASVYVKYIPATDDPTNRQHNGPDIPKDEEGYLSLSGIKKLDLEALRKQLKEASSARALIIDLRQTSHLQLSDMALLLGLMMPVQAKPVIIAAQQWRCDEWKDARSPEGFEPASGFFPLSFHGWNEAEREVIQIAINEYGIPDDSLAFSEPHFLLAHPEQSSLNIQQPIIWLTDHSSSVNTIILIEAAQRILKRSYHIGVPLQAPVGSVVSRQLVSGANIEITTSRLLNERLSPFPGRLDPDRALFESPEDLQQNRQPIMRAINRFLEAPLRTVGSY